MKSKSATPYFLSADGEMAELMRTKDWSETPLGAPENWPRELKVTLDIVLHSDFPMFLFWGEDLRCFYNDAYRPSLGVTGKHPSILGMEARYAWEEIWEDIEPLLRRVTSGEGTVYLEDQLIPFYRNGELQDMYWTFSYGPVRNENEEIVAVLTVCKETTTEVQQRMDLQRSEERFRSMAEDTEMYMVTGDDKGEATYFNPAWTKLTGLSTKELTGFQWQSIMHPDDRESFTKLYMQALMERKAFSTEARVRDRDGNFRWLLTNATPRFHTNGHFLGYIGIFTDITQRKELEEELEFFKIMADKAIDPFILMASDASFPYLNRAALEKWGYSEKEAREIKVPDVDPIFDMEKFEQLFIQAQKEKIPLFETIHKNKSGEIYPVEVTVTGIELGGEPFMLAIARDITTRRKAEKRVKESEKQFRLLAEQSPVWVWMTDVDINVQYANKPMLKFFGMSQVKEFTGKVWETVVHPEDHQTVYENFSKARKSRSAFQYDVRARDANSGEFYWFHIKAVPRFEEDHLVGYIGTAVNIDEQKEFTRRLEDEVEERTQALKLSNQELEKMNKELESFAYISSHDLQEPLRKIQMFSSQILSRDYDSLSDKSKDKFERMQGAARRMQALIRDLLAYSKSQSGDMHFEKCNLEELVQEVVGELDEELRAKKGIVEVTNLPAAEVVSFQFEQLIYNLLSNSIKFVPADRTPEIRVEGKKVTGAEVPFDEADAKEIYCQITVSDNGIGFEQKYAERIFEVFQRLHGKTEFTGTGIGLSIVKKIVENHNGFITASGEKDKGATFRIYIPIKQTRETAQASN